MASLVKTPHDTETDASKLVHRLVCHDLLFGMTIWICNFETCKNDMSSQTCVCMPKRLLRFARLQSLDIHASVPCQHLLAHVQFRAEWVYLEAFSWFVLSIASLLVDSPNIVSS